MEIGPEKECRIRSLRDGKASAWGREGGLGRDQAAGLPRVRGVQAERRERRA